MRKTIFIFSSLILLSSCFKKDRVCECTNTHTNTNPISGYTDVTTDKVTVKKVTKKWMKTWGQCVSTESSNTQNGVVGYDGFGNPVYGNYTVIYKSDCEIK
jgi:hypothetical protein